MTFISCPSDLVSDKKGYTFFTNYECLDFTSPGMELAMTFSLAYFLVDSVATRLAFGPGHFTNQSILHHVIGILGFGSAILIGRAVGVFALALMITELSTIFLNNRSVMKELDMDNEDKYKSLYEWNGISLVCSFFLSRIVFLGIVIIGYVLPTIFNYDYDSAIKDVGWIKIRWAQLTMILYIGLYLLNIFWFYKLVQGARRYRRAQAKMADNFVSEDKLDC